MNKSLPSCPSIGYSACLCPGDIPNSFHSLSIVLHVSFGISQASEKFGKFFKSYSELLSKFGAISVQEYVSQGITHPVF